MSDRILIGSRKGLFTFTRGGDGWTFAREDFLGSPVTFALADPRDGTLYVATNLGHFGPKLHRSRDDGQSWQEIAMPAYAPVAEGETAPSVHQIWALTPAGDDRPGGLWAGTIPGGLFYSADGGDSWTLNESLWNVPSRENWFGGGYDHPGIHSVCVDPRNSDRVAVAVSCGGVWLTEDGGKNWQLATDGLRAAYLPPEMSDDGSMQDPHRMVQSAGNPDAYWIQHHNGIFRSDDDLASWRELEPADCPSFGFAVVVHPRDGETAWFVPAVKDEYRYPQDGKFVISRTTDGGKSFEVIDTGLPAERSYDLVYRHGLDIDTTGERLVMGSTTGGAWVSENGGDSWSPLPVRLPPVYAVAFA